MHAIDALLENLIDYAGLFPPAALSMEEAVRNYASYRESADRSALSSFVVPVARVDEMLGLVALADSPWPLSLLWPRGAAADGPPTRALRDHEPRVRVAAIEARATNPDELAALAEWAGETPLFVEFSWREDPGPWVEALARLGLRAKIRTGGIAEDLVPPMPAVGRFLRACLDRGVPFKATAGLHHPVRGEQNLTYEEGSPRAILHGYLNVFVGSMLYGQGAVDADGLLEVLGEMDPGAFQSQDRALSWREHQLTAADIREFRRERACSFGSCSFTEPLDDLRELEMR